MNEAILSSTRRLLKQTVRKLLNVPPSRFALLFVAVAEFSAAIIILTIDLLWDNRLNPEMVLTAIVTPAIVASVIVVFVTAMLSELREEVAWRKGAEAELKRLNENQEQNLRELTASQDQISQQIVQIESAQQEWLQLIDAVPDAIFSHDREMRVVRSNAAYAAKAGLPIKEVIGQPYWTLFPKHSGPLPSCLRALDSGEIEEEELQLPGNATYMMRSRKVVTDGEYRTSIHVITDITAARHAESELRLRAMLLDNASDSIVLLDLDGNFVYLNERAWKSRGYTRDEMSSMNLHDLDTPENAANIPLRTAELLDRGHAVFECAHRRKNGTVMPIEVSASIIESDGRNLILAIMRDITEQRIAKQETKRFKYILDKTLDMIFMFDPKTFNLVYLNEGAVASLGYAREELIGTPIWKIEPRFPEPVFRSHIAPLLRGEKPSLAYETVHRRKDGTELPVEVFLQLVEEYGGKRLFVAISRDLTERRNIDKLKSEFISTVSHELRTPLTSILGSLGLLRGGVAGELPAEFKPMIDIAFHNSERLVRLINDILDIEKIDAGKMRFELKTVELMPLVEQAVEVNRGYADHHQVTLALVDTAPGARVEVDPDRFAQLLANLLSNAAKYSPSGGQVTVAVRDTGDMLRVEVTDQGPGIPKEFHERIFHKFSQADSAGDKQKGGTGLGLSISKAIVERMGGMIGFESEPGHGATFYFELPHAGGAANATTNDKDDFPPRVLVCEGNPEFSGDLRDMLEQRGYRVDVAHSAEETRQLLAQQRYSAMTLDIVLPGQDGVSLMRELKSSPDTANLPIVMVSAYASAGQQRMLDGLAVLELLDKPIDPERLFAMMREQSRRTQGPPVILHIEDDLDIRQILKSLVGNHGEIVPANGLAAAKLLLEFHYFDLVVLDIGLPDGSGLDILPYLAERKVTVPIVVFSASEIDGDVANKVDAALVKSRIDNQQLLETIMGLIEKHKKNPAGHVAQVTAEHEGKEP